MTKNLNVTHYRNGDPIPEIRDSLDWINTSNGAWCHNKNEPTYGPIYGKLYNWFTIADIRGLTPTGWHVPTQA